MASIAVLLIMAGCAAYQFLKGDFVKSFVSFMAALCASIVAFAWFEQLANLLFIQRETLPNWAQAISFVILFIVVFAVLQAVGLTIARQSIDLGINAERAGRIVFGLLLGFIVSGALLTAASMAPLSGSFPYRRFEPARPDPQNASRTLLNPDGFISRFFGVISSGCLGGDKSFAALHDNFIDPLFLNRLMIAKDVSPLAESGTIELPSKAAVWHAPDGLKDPKGAPLSAGPDHDIIFVRVGFTGKAARPGGAFILGQLRLICKPKGDNLRFQGNAVNAYPVGYLKTAGQVILKNLADQITLQSTDIKGNLCQIDFAFYVPSGFEPVALAYKTNIILQLSPPVTADQAPAPITFIQSSGSATGSAKITPATSAKIYGLELTSGQKLLEGTTLYITGQSEWNSLQKQDSTRPARFEQDQITCVQTELQEPNRPERQSSRENKLPQMFKPAQGYSLLSLKCNNPAVGSAITGEQLPSLIDSTGAIHRPCGLIAAGKVEGSKVFEVDYCASDVKFDGNSAATKSLPENIPLAEKAQSISEFYVLYLVKPNTIILSVRPAGAQSPATFEGTEGFLVN